MLALIVSLVALLSPVQAEATYRVYVGDTSTPVKAGTIWLLMYSWYGSEKVPIGFINDGVAHVHFDHHSMYLLDESNRLDGNHDDHYMVLIELPGAQWYVSKSIEYQILFARWKEAIGSLGQTVVTAQGEEALVLPRPATRTITLVRTDGSPAANMSVRVAVHISWANHCGVEEGPSLGEHLTDKNGRFTLISPPTPLYLEAPYVDPSLPSRVSDETTTGRQQHITARRAWGIPPRVLWRVAIRGLDGFPVEGAVVGGYEDFGCGSNWDFVTDDRGVAYLHFIPQLLGWVTIEAKGGSRWLTDSERKQLERTQTLTLDWPSEGGAVPPACDVSVLVSIVSCSELGQP